MRTKIVTITDSFHEIVSSLSEFLKNNQVIYVFFDQNISDFKQDYNGNIVLLGKKNSGIKIVLPEDYLSSFIGILTLGLFNGKILFTWDIKQLFSYFYFRLKRNHIIDVSSKIIDIKYGEAFLGIDGKRPDTFEDACSRAKLIARNEVLLKIHKDIHIPLAVKVLPKIETVGVADAEDRMLKYPCYQIEGQQNGRLKCVGGTLMAHNLKREDRLKLRPKMDHKFAVFDFKSMEVYVLQWLSKDERLGKIISSGRDIYTTLYSLLYGRKCNKENRQLIKDSFLPIVYGMQADSLSERLKVNLDESKELLKRINGFFSTAMNWVQDQQNKTKESSIVCDYFQRPRDYTDRFWAVRNAVVQGPASIVCLEKLISLFDKVFNYCEIVANIHDAYVLDIPCNVLYDVVYYATEVLQAPSVFMPGLKLTIDVNVGDDLENINPFRI